MTTLLERAMKHVQELPESEQDSIAAVILDELESEARWQVAFAGSQDQLAELGREALAEYEAGMTHQWPQPPNL